MKFAVPRIWSKPGKNHETDCFFCMVNFSKRRRGKNAKHISLPDIPSSTATIPQDDTRPVPSAPKKALVTDEENSYVMGDDVFPNEPADQCSDSDDSDYPGADERPNILDQHKLNDIIRDMDLSKTKGELLSSRLRENRLVEKNVRITNQRTRHTTYSKFYTMRDGICFCFNIWGLFSALNFLYKPSDWRLFVDGSKKSLKAVLLHNGNTFPSIPVAYCKMKETYDSMKTLLDLISYKKHEWLIVADFKVIAFLTGMKGGYPSFPCILCHWKNRETSEHYKKKNWPKRSKFVIGEKSVIAEALVDVKKILFPPLHIKLWLMKQFTKALEQTSEAYQYLKIFFPKLSEAKIKGGTFNGPGVRRLMHAEDFEELLIDVQREAWKSFKAVVEGFLGNKKAPNYEDLDTHLAEFTYNLGDYSEEQGDRFHQDIRELEKRYDGKECKPNMLGEYIWSRVRSTSTVYKRNKRQKMSYYEVKDD